MGLDGRAVGEKAGVYSFCDDNRRAICRGWLTERRQDKGENYAMPRSPRGDDC